MQEIIAWLRGVEHRAAGLYDAIADGLSDDPRIQRFFRRLAEDEAWHFHLMGSAAESIREHRLVLPAGIRLDEQTRGNVETPLGDCWARAESGAIDAKTAVESLVRAEFSEWNAVFLYVVNSLKELSKPFAQAASAIQAHERRIERFLDGLPHELRPAQHVRDLPTVWTPHYLIVDDESSLLVCLKLYFSRVGVVDTAANGKEALGKAGSRHYDVIISDIQMPVMDGLAFFRAAVSADPDVSKRFIFCSGAIGERERAFFREHGLAYFDKPVSVFALRDTAERMLRKA